ncbi:MAG: acyl-CoA thioesterase [Holophagaceae bacterium]
MPFQHPISVRFRDLDALQHVNNAVTVTYLETARFAWWQGYLQTRSFESEGFLIARIEVDYKKPILLTHDVRVEIQVTHVGTKSFHLAYRIFDALTGDTLATALTVQVMLDFTSLTSKPISASAVDWLRQQIG